MMLSYVRIGLLSLSLGFSADALANIAQHQNYYLASRSSQLANTEKYHLEQALHKQAQGEQEQAWNELAFVLHYFPNHPRALALISELSASTGQMTRAARYFERAVQLYPLEAVTHHLYGQFLMRDAKYNEAITQFKEAIRLDNDIPDHHYQLGLAYFALQNYAFANKEAHQALSLGYNVNPLKEKLTAVGAWKPTKKQSN